MIGVCLQGGLGNQMFQYAAARALAAKHDTKVILDLSWYDRQFTDGTTPRHYELGCFALDASVKKMDQTFRSRLHQKLSHKYTEPHFHFDPAFKGFPGRTQLSGYFQSEQYFRDIRPTLLQDFTWKNAPSGKNEQLLTRIQKNPSSVSVHVRRGDYVSNSAAARMHGLTGVEYYRRAEEYVSKHVKNPQLFVFSDDPDWCKKNLKFTHPTTYVSHNADGAEDLRLMQACGHNIIANSSFSWWGAWLNRNANKVIVAPKRWFLHTESNTKDVIPKAWHKL